jgi:putative effector of murein hydrolase|tara:strand:+ start:3721 stop:4425 length:705 start_codon:yes stop_codon:yes gene_type:complete
METASLAVMFTLTLFAFGAAAWVFGASQPGSVFHFFLHPLVVGPFLVTAFLILLRIDYQQYRVANEPFFFLLDTTIVALAVPLHQQFYNFRIVAKPLLTTLIFSVFFASISAVGCALMLGADISIMVSLAPKSATTPMALRIAEKIGGNLSMTAGIVVLTGITGAIFGPALFNKLGIKDDRIKGFVLGICAHGIGTAKALEISRKCGAFAILGLGATGILTALILPCLVLLLIK